MGRLDGKVAFITGAARGQGREHAVRLAEEGADVIAVDRCEDVPTVPYALATPEDLDETVRQVEAHDRRIVATKVDVRDASGLRGALRDGVAELGRLDVVVANAGISSGFKPSWELSEEEWREMVDVNLKGVWHTLKAAAEVLVEQGEGGAMVATSSTAGLKGFANVTAYDAAKHGVVGLARTFAVELAPHRVRVNTLHPTTVRTPMIENDATFGLFRPDLEHPTLDDAHDAFLQLNLLPVPWVEVRDISSALLWLVSDDARYVTGAALPVDAGFLVK